MNIVRNVLVPTFDLLEFVGSESPLHGSIDWIVEQSESLLGPELIGFPLRPVNHQIHSKAHGNKHGPQAHQDFGNL